MKKPLLSLCLCLVMCIGLLSGMALAAAAIPAEGTAYVNTQTIHIDNLDVTFYTYALRDEKGNDINFVKLRDIAIALNGTEAQFSVRQGPEGAILLTTGEAYTAVGTEMVRNLEGDQPYKVCESPVEIDGVLTDLVAITLTDANGGEYNYFKLRDLGEAMDFNMVWSLEEGVRIEPDKPYVKPN